MSRQYIYPHGNGTSYGTSIFLVKNSLFKLEFEKNTAALKTIEQETSRFLKFHEKSRIYLKLNKLKIIYFLRKL